MSASVNPWPDSAEVPLASMGQNSKTSRGKLPWWRGTLAALAEGIIIGAAVYFLTGQQSWPAAIFTFVVVSSLRVERRVFSQIQPGEEVLLEKLAASLPGMVYQCRLWPTGKCTLTYANNALEWIYEMKLEDMKKDCRPIFDLVHPDDRDVVWDSLAESALHLTPWKGEYRVVLPRQGVRWRFAQARVERLSDGSTLWQGFVADVTWRHETEARILAAADREAGALRDAKEAAENSERLKSEFLTMMSHEIRTPLNGVIGFAELLKNSSLAAEQHQYVDMIEQSGERLLAMINHTLDLAKIESGNFTVKIAPFDLRGILQECFELLRPVAQKKGLAYEMQIPDGTPVWMVTDSIHFSQILINLLGNAIKFTERGRVQLRVEAAPATVPAGVDQIAWIFVVSDTGLGIDSDVIPKLFERFYQVESSASRRYQGSGLGLAISKRLAEFLGGDLTVQSQLGIGSEFALSLKTPAYTE